MYTAYARSGPIRSQNRDHVAFKMNLFWARYCYKCLILVLKIIYIINSGYPKIGSSPTTQKEKMIDFRKSSKWFGIGTVDWSWVIPNGLNSSSAKVNTRDASREKKRTSQDP